VFEIRHRLTKRMLYRSETATGIRQAVVEAGQRGADLREADLRGAHLSMADLNEVDLRWADMSGAYLHGAYLRASDLSEVNLSGAYLDEADLSNAILIGADLSEADLTEAKLSKANLSGVNLSGANMLEANLRCSKLNDAKFSDNTIMPYGETWREYLEVLVPRLLTAGGKPLATVARPEHWECRDWNNCPMAIAFDIPDVFQAPLLLRPRVIEFVQFFDANLIPMPSTL
jgi:uncharacterized protein YjbI with pentapeptide repeats